MVSWVKMVASYSILVYSILSDQLEFILVKPGLKYLKIETQISSLVIGRKLCDFCPINTTICLILTVICCLPVPFAQTFRQICEYIIDIDFLISIHRYYYISCWYRLYEGLLMEVYSCFHTKAIINIHFFNFTYLRVLSS